MKDGMFAVNQAGAEDQTGAGPEVEGRHAERC